MYIYVLFTYPILLFKIVVNIYKYTSIVYYTIYGSDLVYYSRIMFNKLL